MIENVIGSHQVNKAVPDCFQLSRLDMPLRTSISSVARVCTLRLLGGEHT